jgi:hypothetical protein
MTRQDKLQLQVIQKGHVAAKQDRPRSAFKAPLIEHEIALGSAPLDVIPVSTIKKILSYQGKSDDHDRTGSGGS